MIFSQLEEGVIACCERIRQCVTARSAAHVQADPRLREELKAAEAKIGLQAQTELLQLVKSSGWTTTRISVTKALWETFPVGSEGADTRRRFEVDRTASISRTGKLIEAENPNAFGLPGKQSKRRTQAPTPATRIPAPKHSLPQLDTPTPKRPRADEPATPDLPTPTSAPKTRVSTLPVVDYSLPSPAKANTEACESDETFEDSEEEAESDIEFDDLEERLLDNDSDTEDLPADESVPVTERLPFAKTTVLVPFVDENGLTRIGTQPMKPAVYIGWAPRVDAADRIRNRALQLWGLVDSKFLVSVPIDNSAEIKGLQENIMGFLGNYLNDESKVMLRCDYTGVEMSWAAGPQSWSIEAIYPYIVILEQHSDSNIY
ncbi:hypothetical protein H0G86_012002 [Trichoderma simmonsii]|uniref:Uncharacterized protein n=1 Tax=Trichoderma simmonsii TaxID=1491479 RepID=A0A8G0PJU1_9HYPO|nr:hypothetical protein H0G86_012002 [Trichoderma simmonsii]